MVLCLYNAFKDSILNKTLIFYGSNVHLPGHLDWTGPDSQFSDIPTNTVISADDSPAAG